MRAQGRLSRWPRHQQPSRAAREAIATVQRILTCGCTAEEQAQARAELDALRMPRQGALPLKVKS